MHSMKENDKDQSDGGIRMYWVGVAILVYMVVHVGTFMLLK